MSRVVLVVDDDRQMVRTLCDILRLRGWEAVAAYSGEEALAACAQRYFPIVLMDIRMEGINGVETLKRLRAIAPRSRTILMTAYTSNELLREAQREGALEILSKPVALPALMTTLDRALAEAQTVLIVDNKPDFVRTLAASLRHGGYDVAEAGNLPDALARLGDSSAGVVVLDLCLDHLDPAEAVYAVKRLSPEVLLILYSGHHALLDRVVSTLPADWVQGILHKPFSPERLIEIIHEIDES